MKEIILSGNTQWLLEAIFQLFEKESVQVTPGFYGLSQYDFSLGKKDKLECVHLVYDEKKINLIKILDVFFDVHNPMLAQWNKDCFFPLCRSSVIIPIEEKEKRQEVENYLKQKEQKETKIIQMIPSAFSKTDEKYLCYYLNNKDDPYCKTQIEPKIEKIKEKYNKHV